MKTNIITDTNVWYNITRKDVLEISNDYKLQLPIIIINELYTSPNLWKSESSFNSLKTAIRNILENIENINFIEFDPFEFLLKQVKSDLIPRLSLSGYIQDLRALVQLSYEQVKDIRPDRGDISNLTNYINDQSKEYKKLIKSDEQKFRRLNTKHYTEKLILGWANDNLELIGIKEPKITTLDKEKNELLVDTFDELLRLISRSEAKIKDNDWVDIFNLTYVAKGDLYWTKEKSKLNHIENSGNKHYIFERSFN